MAASTRMMGAIRPSDDYVESSEALAILEVKPQTLYSYVSRGLVRRISPNGRSSFYNREDLHRLKARSKARAGHGAVAESAMHWGEPVLSTSITEITAQGPRYRAHLALDLVRDGQRSRLSPNISGAALSRQGRSLGRSADRTRGWRRNLPIWWHAIPNCTWDNC